MSVDILLPACSKLACTLLRCCVVWILCGLPFSQVMAFEASYAEREEVQAFIEAQVGQGAEREALESLFKRLTPDRKVLELMDRAPERKSTWPGYRDIFIGEKRIREGADFIRTHSELFAQAEAKYGVPTEIIAAILGVETFYGKITGGKKVVRSLATLAFDYPRRSSFFLGELEAFLRICREQGFDPQSLTGSYAGAMGYAQFMPSSYLSYAVDFNGDEVIDIWQDPADAIGSIAHYLIKAGGWIPGRDMLEQVDPVDKSGFANLVTGSLRPAVSRAQLNSLGIEPARLVEDDVFKLIKVENPEGEGEQYWIGGKNFYAVTRYNISTYYTMTVFQLAELIGEKAQANSSE